MGSAHTRRVVGGLAVILLAGLALALVSIHGDEKRKAPTASTVDGVIPDTAPLIEAPHLITHMDVGMDRHLVSPEEEAAPVPALPLPQDPAQQVEALVRARFHAELAKRSGDRDQDARITALNEQIQSIEVDPKQIVLPYVSSGTPTDAMEHLFVGVSGEDIAVLNWRFSVALPSIRAELFDHLFAMGQYEFEVGKGRIFG